MHLRLTEAARPPRRDPGPAEAGIRTRSSELPFRGYTLFFRYVNDEPCVVHIISSRRDLDGFVADD